MPLTELDLEGYRKDKIWVNIELELVHVLIDGWCHKGHIAKLLLCALMLNLMHVSLHDAVGLW